METSPYTPLKEPERDIRLLSILPAPTFSLEDLLECKTQAVSLYPPPPCYRIVSLELPPPTYLALSYCWGDTSDTLPIQVNDSTLPVTRNLVLALRRLRQRYSPSQYFWIDAVCINQADNGEKSHQVARMRDIFSAAESVVIWMGEEDDDTGLQIGVFERYAQYGTQIPGQGRTELSEVPPLSVAEEFAVEAFLDSPYFTRRWIIQECVVSRNADMLYGSRNLPVDRFFKACRVLISIPWAGLGSWKCWGPCLLGAWWKDYNAIRAGDIDSGSDLMELLSESRDKFTTDPRDKVYSLLGIAKQRQRQHLVVDYGKSVEEVFANAARTLLDGSDTLHVLSAVERQDSNLNLPSWVPDWAQEWRGGPLDPVGSRYPRFSAAGSTEPVLSFSSPEPALRVRGFVLDTIRTIFQSSEQKPFALALDESIPIETRVINATQLLGMQSEGIYAPTGEPFRSTMFRTFTADRSMLSYRVDLKPEPHLLRWRGWIEAGFPEPRPPEEMLSDVENTIFMLQHKMTPAFGGEYLGLAPKTTQPSDLVCIFLGGTVPYILRPLGDGNYELIGECYIHGVMDGEAMAGKTEADFRDFVII